MATNFTSDDTEDIEVPTGGRFTVACNGDFGGGTLSVKYYSDATWVAYSSGDTGDFTAAGERVFYNVGELPKIRLQLASSTSPDLNIVVCNEQLDL